MPVIVSVWVPVVVVVLKEVTVVSMTVGAPVTSIVTPGHIVYGPSVKMVLLATMIGCATTSSPISTSVITSSTKSRP